MKELRVKLEMSSKDTSYTEVSWGTVAYIERHRDTCQEEDITTYYSVEYQYPDAATEGLWGMEQGTSVNPEDYE